TVAHPNAIGQARIDIGSPSHSRWRKYHQRALDALGSARHEVVVTCSPEAAIIVARIVFIAISALDPLSLRPPVLPTVFPHSFPHPVRRLIGSAFHTALR